MSLKVALLRNSQGFENLSMKYYAHQLAHGLEEIGIEALEIAGPRSLQMGRVSRLCKKAEGYFTRYWRYPQSLSSIRADLYHIIDHANSHWLRVLPSERTVVTCHDLMLLKLAAGEIPWVGHRPRIAHIAFRWSAGYLRQAGAVVCVSECTKQDAVRLLGCSSNRLYVVHQGIHEAFGQVFDPDIRANARKRFGFTWPITLLHVGHNLFYKNLEGIIEALALLPAKWRHRIHLVKAGEDFTTPQWNLVRRRGVGDRVHSLGQLSLQDLVLLYNVADVLIFPSLYEGFGWPPLESMACGTPVVCSDRGSLGEVVGDAACLVNPEDSGDIMRGAIRVCEDEPYRQELVRRGLERAKHFRWDRAAQQFRFIYYALLHGKTEAGHRSGDGIALEETLRPV